MNNQRLVEEEYHRRRLVEEEYRRHQQENRWRSELMPWDSATTTSYTSHWPQWYDYKWQSEEEEPWRDCTCKHPDHKLRLMAYRIKFLKSVGKCDDILSKMEGAKVCCIFKELKRLKIIT